MRHGSSTGYDYHKCRCTQCCAAKYEATHKPHLVVRRNAMRAHRLYIIGIIKTTAGCVDCGYDVHPAALDFDHVAEKLFNIGQATMSSWKKLFDEIMKCEVRCANCHRIKTVERRQNG